jgi:HK97 family phage portal protein
MGLFGRQQRDFYGITGAQDLIPGRATGGTRKVGNQVVTDDKAMRHSVVWACLKLRAGLLSTFPLDQYRDVQGIRTEWPYKPPILTDPGGAKVSIRQWLAMSQVDLDRSGNCVGLIVERNTAKSRYYPEGLPNRIELQPASACSYVKHPDKPPMWRIDGKLYDPKDVYHEATNQVAGFELGLPTVLYAALNIGEALSMQQFGLDWFSNGGIPKARMRNTAKRLDAKGISTAKQWYADVVTDGSLLVMGADWEYDLIQAQTAGNEFIAGRQLAAADICRYFDTPGDLVDVSTQGSAITYANITQRNLQFLIYHMGPTVIGREEALTRLLPQPRYVKLNTDALLRMDPETRAKVLKMNIEARLVTNAEGRALDDRQPLTAEQKAEFMEIYGVPKASPTSSVSIDSTGGAAGGPGEDDDQPASAAVGA